MLEGGLKCCRLSLKCFCVSLKCFCLCSGASCWYYLKTHLPYQDHLLECSDQQRENSNHRCTVHRNQFLGRWRCCQPQHNRVCYTFGEILCTKCHTSHRSSLSHSLLQNDLYLCCLFPSGNCGHVGKISEEVGPWQRVPHLCWRESESLERLICPLCSQYLKSTGSSCHSPLPPMVLKMMTRFYWQSDLVKINNQCYWDPYPCIHLPWELVGTGNHQSRLPQESLLPHKALCWGSRSCKECDQRCSTSFQGQESQRGPGDTCLQRSGGQQHSWCSQ